MLFAAQPMDAIGPRMTRFDLVSFSTPQMQAFHIAWLAFLVCFFARFAAALPMPLIKAEFAFTNLICGATSLLVPFVDRKAPGGIGAIPVGFLNKSSSTPRDCLIVLGYVIAGCWPPRRHVSVLHKSQCRI